MKLDGLQIYEWMTGMADCPGGELWVEDEFSDGKSCQMLSDTAYEEKIRLEEGLTPEQRKILEHILELQDQIALRLCLRMCEYGRKLGGLGQAAEKR